MIRKYFKAGFVVFYLLCLSLSSAQDFSATINVAGRTAGLDIDYNLTFGFSPDATDGYDEDNDYYAPPAPPPPAFDAALGWAGDRYYTQILAGDGDLSEHIYDIALAYGEDNLITISWDNTGWTDMMASCLLQDAFGGVMFNVDMLTDTSLELTNPAFNLLKLKVTPTDFVSSNLLPIADAGPDTTGRSSMRIYLDGSGSYDPDADDWSQTPIVYKWTTDSLDISIDDDTLETASFIAPLLEVGADPVPYSIILTVTDVVGGTDKDTVVITILPPVPTANAGQDQTVTEGNEVDLNGAGSASLEGEDYYFHWEVPDGIELSDTTAENPRFIAPFVENDTNYPLILTVEDGVSPDPSGPDTVVITVKDNQPPIAVAGNDVTVVQGETVALNGSGSDDTDVSEIYGSLTYLWIAPAGITLSNNTEKRPTFTAPSVPDTTDFVFSLVVNDGEFDSDLDTVAITVTGNVAPEAYFTFSNEKQPDVVVEGEEVTLDWNFTADTTEYDNTEHSYDFNNDQLSIQWMVDPVSIDLSTYTAGQPRFYAPAVTDEEGTLPVTVTLIINDGSLSDTAKVVIPVLNNDKPNANAGSDKEEYEDVTVVLNGSASQDPTDVSTVLGPLNYAWTAPSSITLSDVAASNPTFTAPVVTDTTNFEFVLVVNDGELDSEEDTVVVTMIGNQAPEADAGMDQTIHVPAPTLLNSLGIDVTVALDGSGSTDNNDDELSYLWTIEQGEGITLSGSSISNPAFIIPNSVEVDTFEFLLKVTDEHGLFDISDSTVAIFIAQNDSATADAGEDQTVDQGIEVTLDGQGFDDTDVSNLLGSLTYNWTTPSGIVLSSSTAQSPSFTAPDEIDATSYIFYLVVNDGEYSSSPDSVTVTVLPNKPPVVNAGSDQDVDQGTIVTLDGSASSDPNNDDLEFHWELWSSPSDDGIPVEITLSDTAVANPSFTAPDRNEISYYVFLLTVNDGFMDSEADHVRHDSPAKVTITVLQNKPPVADAGADKKAYRGNSVMLSGTGSTDINFDGITFEWSSGDSVFSTDSSPYFYLPGDLSQNTEYTFHLRVIDEHGDSSLVDDTMLIYSLVDSVAPPDVPNVYITAEHRKVIISWDASAEESIDPFSGYSDFEGYKVYKSTDGGETWGGAQNKIYDYYGNFVGWRPIVQFDYTETQDTSRCIYENSFGCEDGVRREEISGLDPMASRINLGSNSGLQHSFIDSNVVDGFEYTYSVTSYDMGLRTYIHTYIPIIGSESLYQDSTEWSPSNPAHGLFGPDSLPVYGAYKSLECTMGSSDADPNFVSIIPGFKASNISFPDIENAEEFIVPNEGTIGNGEKFYAIVDESLLTDDLLRFEIQAELLIEDVNKDGIIETKSNTDNNMDYFNGYPTGNPLLFAYEVLDTLSQLPVNVGNEYSIGTLSTAQQDSLMGLPGADSLSGIIRLPQYKIEAFPLKYLDDTDYESNWTDIFDGVRLRFDNSLKSVPQNFQAVIKNQYSLPDTGLINNLDIELEFGNQGIAFNQRPPYSYKIEFSTSTLDTAQEVTPSGGCTAAHEGFNTILPFKVTNLTTGKHVPVRIMDKGLDGKTATNDDGEGDCVWERGEEIHFTFDSVKTTFGADGRLNTQDDDIPFPNYTFILKLDFKYFNFFAGYTEPWKDDTTYTSGADVKHEGMIWHATGFIPMGTDPVTWMDDGNGNNINPWEIQYWWEEGDYIVIEPTRWYKDGDSWIADMSLLGKSHAVTQEDLEMINVVPNPYLAQSWFQTPQNPYNRLRFIHLPQQCRITIFTITGERVVTLDHNNEYDSNEWWDLKNGSGRDIAPGLYIYTVESGDLTPHIGKFAVIR